MKNTYALSMTFILCATLSMKAYEFSFHNGIENPIAIAIQFTGNDGIKEPLYKQLVKPQSMITFTPGKNNIPEIKWGFCLDQVYYVENPTQEQKMHNFEKAPWRKVTITWVEETSTTKKKSVTKKVIIKENKPAATPYSAEATKGRPAEKSLCRDRHFDIIRDEQKKITITSSLNE
jgi:hypothetical protein